MLTLQVPDSLAKHQENTVCFIAAKLYESGKLSLGQAIEMTGLSKRSFAEILARYGLSYPRYTSDDLAEDFRHLSEL